MRLAQVFHSLRHDPAVEAEGLNGKAHLCPSGCQALGSQPLPTTDCHLYFQSWCGSGCVEPWQGHANMLGLMEPIPLRAAAILL